VPNYLGVGCISTVSLVVDPAYAADAAGIDLFISLSTCLIDLLISYLHV